MSKLFALHLELAESLPGDALVRRLPSRSNTIGEQFWCVVGARESYSKAMVAGAWTGFSCSLTGDGTRDKATVVEHLRESARRFDAVAGEVLWDATRADLLVSLLEHEAQHQGQLIRYSYALGHPFPPGWRERWSLRD